MNFRELGLIDPILKALAAQGYESPTPIQRGAIPPALAGRDVLGCAQTGTGKTCAFSTPILQRLNKRIPKPRTIRALILTPTRELALQIQECFEAYGKNLPLRSAVIFGGVGQGPQVEKLKRGVDILVATPGRLLDLYGQGLIDLFDVEIFVLDEADRMLDMGFIHDVRRVLKVLPEKKQTLFFSATMPPEVMELVNALLHDYVRVEVDPVSSPVEVIRQSLYFVDKSNKTRLLGHLIEEKQMDSVLVFSRTKHGANRIAGDLNKHGIPAAAIHGNKSQTARQQALADFKKGKIRALVATDIAARGIDIDELKWVINYDLPEVPETYVHRIGRTGRAGHDGSALSFCRADEKGYLKQIEKLLGKKLPVVEEHPFPMTEAPTGVDPMIQARREAKEHARANRAAQNGKKKEEKTVASVPAPAKQESKQSAEKKPEPVKEVAQPKKPKQKKAHKQQVQPASTPAKEKSAPVKEKAAPIKEKTVPVKEKPVQKSKRGVRQGDLSAVQPEAPSLPTTDFVKPNPLDSDVIMDATARLLAPRKPMFSQPKPAPAQEQSKGGGNHKNHAKKKKGGQQNKQAEPVIQKAEKQPAHPAPKKAEKKMDKKHPVQSAPKKAEHPSKSPKQEKTVEVPKPMKASGVSHPASKQKNRQNGRRYDGPRPIQRSLYSMHQKDSTEQKESVMKPYYLSDE